MRMGILDWRLILGKGWVYRSFDHAKATCLRPGFLPFNSFGVGSAVSMAASGFLFRFFLIESFVSSYIIINEESEM